MADPTFFRDGRAAAAFALLMGTSSARAAEPASTPARTQTADRAGPIVRPVAPGVRPTNLRWHDTYFYWDNAVSADTLGVGQDYQSRDPAYEITFGLRPRYYLLETDQQSVSIRGDLGVVSERTNSDTTTRRNEWSATDLELYGAFAYELRKSADDLTELSVRMPRLIFPTSKISYDGGKLVSVGTRVALREDVALEGRSATFFPNLELFAKVDYDYLFTRSETPTNSELERIRLGPDGRSVVSDQLSGASFARHSLDFGIGTIFHVHERVLWTTTFDIRPAWKYPIAHDTEVCVSTGCTEASGPSNPVTRSTLTYFTSSVLVTLTDTFALSAGYANISAQLGPDGRRRSVFYSPDARFYATLSISLDHLYTGLAHHGERSASLAPRSSVH